MKIYADVLICINFIINFTLLQLTKQIFNANSSNKRLYFSAFIGAISSLIIFIPIKNFIINIIYKFLVTYIMIIIAFNERRLSLVIKYNIILLVISFIFNGIIIGLSFLFPNLFFVFVNGTVYFDIPPILLIMCVVIAYLFVSMMDKIIDNGNIKNSSYIAKIYRDNKTVTLNCYFDTGNKMTETFSNLPVMLVQKCNIDSILYREEKECIYNNGPPCISLRPIFYQTINGNGMLYAFKPDKITIISNNTNKNVEGYIAVANDNINCNGCHAIIGHKFLGSFSQ